MTKKLQLMCLCPTHHGYNAAGIYLPKEEASDYGRVRRETASKFVFVPGISDPWMEI